MPFNIFIEENMKIWSDQVRRIIASFASAWISQKASIIAEKIKGIGHICVYAKLVYDLIYHKEGWKMISFDQNIVLARDALPGNGGIISLFTCIYTIDIIKQSLIKLLQVIKKPY